MNIQRILRFIAPAELTMETENCDRSRISGLAGTRGLQAWDRLPRARLMRLGICALLISVGLVACKPQTSDPVTITLLDQGLISGYFFEKRAEILSDFTRQTGIQVKILAPPETAADQLALWQALLTRGSSSPDVVGVDVIWPGLLEPYLIDLKPYLGKDLDAYFPKLVASYTVHGKVVAVPVRAGVGVLFYRSDLLKKYGYRAPPKSWVELERVAARIQVGERAAGNPQFWGFVWEGAASEALTCNALEWQVADGGGSVLEADRSVSVNNPKAIQAWERAASWVGSISPPGVVAYTESDAGNVWLAGDAAFMRSWTSYIELSRAATTLGRDHFDVTTLPSDGSGRAGTLGGSGVGVSRYSAHPREAVMLVRYLTRRDTELRWSRLFSDPPTLPELYDSAELLEASPYLAQLKHSFEGGAILRPAPQAGRDYAEISDAYSHAVHSVLTKKRNGASAAADLERDIARIVGLEAIQLPAQPAKRE